MAAITLSLSITFAWVIAALDFGTAITFFLKVRFAKGNTSVDETNPLHLMLVRNRVTLHPVSQVALGESVRILAQDQQPMAVRSDS
jgi:hypothetical protein